LLKIDDESQSRGIAIIDLDSMKYFRLLRKAENAIEIDENLIKKTTLILENKLPG
jgi:hypothetical protein